MRDVLRKYSKNSKTFELLKVINADLTKKINLPESKSALLFIVGEFADKINSSLEILNIFAVNFQNENEKVKAQILNAAIKNFVIKPNNSEDITKYVLEKAGEECENPDIRDRAYIYWRLLENDPDAAKEILLGEKPSFIFKDEESFEKSLLEDLVENLTNISCLYQKKSSEMISQEDLIIEAATSEIDNETEDKNTTGVNDKEDSNIDSTKKEKKKKTKKNKIIETKINTNDFDLLGLGDSGNSVTTINSNPNIYNLDIMDIFGVGNANNNNISASNIIGTNIINQDLYDSTNTKSKQNNLFDVSYNSNISNQLGNYNINNISNNNNAQDVFSDIQFLDEDENSENNIFTSKTGVTQPKPFKALDKSQRGKNGVYGLYVSGLFHRENQKLFLGLHLKNDFHSGMNNFSFEISKNLFGLNFSHSENINIVKEFYLNSENQKNIIFNLIIDQNNLLSTNFDDLNQNLTSPLMIDITVKNNLDDFNFKIPIYLNCINLEIGKMTNQNFMEYFKKFSQNKTAVNYTNDLKSDIINEETLSKILEKNNIFMVAKNSKLDPPVFFYSALLQNNLAYILEISFIKSNIIILIYFKFFSI